MDGSILTAGSYTVKVKPAINRLHFDGFPVKWIGWNAVNVFRDKFFKFRRVGFVGGSECRYCQGQITKPPVNITLHSSEDIIGII